MTQLVAMIARLLLACAMFALACATATAQDFRAAAGALAPTGKLRVLGFANGVFYASSGAPEGLAQEIGSRIASALGVPMQPVVMPNPTAYEGALAGGDWDVAIGPRTAGFGQYLDFGPDLALIDNLYVAGPGKDFADPASVDRPGVRVGVARSSPPEPLLRNLLKNAQLVPYTGGFADAIESIRSGAVDVYAANAESAHAVVAAVPGSRIVGPFNTARVTIGLRKDATPQAREVIARMSAQVNEGNLVRTTAERLGMKGVRPAGVP